MKAYMLAQYPLPMARQVQRMGLPTHATWIFIGDYLARHIALGFGAITLFF